MTLWETNTAILRERYPGLLEEITRGNDRNDDSKEIETEPGASGQLTLKINGIYIHSNRDPVREGKRLAESIDNNTGPIVLLGFGLGYAAQAAAELWRERPLIIAEKNVNLLRIALEQMDLSSLLKRPNVVFAAGGNGSGISGALSLFEESGAERKNPSVIRNRALCGLDEEWYSSAESRIRTWTMRDDVNAATLKRFGKRWIRNLSRNMGFIRDTPGVSRLANIASNRTGFASEGGLPVFLAAAGPGLDQIGSLLPEIRERCIVVAVDTSLRFILSRGISPDFAVIVDPQFWNSRHLDRLLTEKIRLIAESAVYPPALRLPWRSVYLCGSLFPLGSFIEQRVDPKGNLGAGGSVATSAWDFCRILGAQQIWIAGLDLAFPGLKTHFRGAAFEEKSHAQSGRLYPSETWLARALRDGRPFYAPEMAANNLSQRRGGAEIAKGTVLTDRRLSLYATWFENRFSLHPNVRNYSLSSGGLAIAGLECSPMEKLLALPARRAEIDRALEETFSGIETDFFSGENTQARAERYNYAVSALRNGLEDIRANAKKGAEIAKQALRHRQDRCAQEKILRKLDEISSRIAHSEVKEVAGFLFPPAEISNAEDNSGDPFTAYLKSSFRLYSSLAEAVEFNVKTLMECL